ncbi:UBX domain-containing protein 7-like protein [Oopsacas minuta]|uniref:UBX domain-containing protein 7-like protein n=1 Tax=Oopsacas minuta TaxID=111878 RepID=A0AAV7JVF9_9METZ|nr:UBX domain-containing protein 7-like protein [Oopsacas minuta]
MKKGSDRANIFGEDLDIRNGREIYTELDTNNECEEDIPKICEERDFTTESLLTKFMNITQTDESLAQNYLSSCQDDINEAIAMYFQSTLSDNTCALRPLQPRVRECLVKEPIEGLQHPYNVKRKLTDSVFNGDHYPSSPTKKTRRLHDLYKSPADIAFIGSFDQAKQHAKECDNWLIVNIQDMTNFNSHLLNRDIWRSAVIRKHLVNHFTLWQINKDGSDVRWFSRFYDVNPLPYVAILDSTTGKLLMEIKTTDHDKFSSLVEEFLSNYEFPSKQITQIPSCTEDEDLSTAIEASLKHCEHTNQSVINSIPDTPWIYSDYYPTLTPGEPITHILIRCTDGARRPVTFSQSNSIQSLFEYLKHHGVDKDRFEIVSTHPRVVLNNIDPITSFKDANLVPNIIRSLMSDTDTELSQERVAYFRGNTGQELAAELADLPYVPPFEAGTSSGDIVGYTEGVIGLVSRQHPFAQLGIGVGTGWACGVMGRKVGTSVLFLLASGIIVLQLANHSGVVQVNWGRVGEAVNTAYQGQQQQQQQQLGQTTTQLILLKLRENRLWQALAKHSYLNTGLLSGILLGLSL